MNYETIYPLVSHALCSETIKSINLTFALSKFKVTKIVIINPTYQSAGSILEILQAGEHRSYTSYAMARLYT